MRDQYCAQCGQSVPPEGRFCTSCGAPVPTAATTSGCPGCGRSDVGNGLCSVVGVNAFSGAGKALWRASPARRFVALVLDDILLIVTLIVGYLIWWLIVLSRGQTPGKQLAGIWAIKTTGERSGWGNTFLREFVFKGLVFGWLGAITGYVAYALDYLWALWDRDTQTLHDKLASTVVVRAALRSRAVKSEETR